MSKQLQDALIEFCGQEPRGSMYQFPLGDGFDIPQPKESAILDLLPQGLSLEEAETVRHCIDNTSAYDVVIFGCRMCVLSVRCRDVEVAKHGVLGLVLDNDCVDPRDLVVALTIVEDCAVRLGMTLEKTIEGVLHLATPERQHLILSDYCSRSQELRGLAVMRLMAVDEGTQHFAYRKLYG